MSSLLNWITGNSPGTKEEQDRMNEAEKDVRVELSNVFNAEHYADDDDARIAVLFKLARQNPETYGWKKAKSEE
jgi:hypothetical protein